MADKKKAGRCYLVGAGPGDLGLVTLRAKQCIERADVVVYDYLCNPEMLQWAPEEAEIIYAGKKAGAHTLKQEEINQLLVEKTRDGQQVVRLKGGDPFLFGRGGEEAQALAAASIPFEVVPGVTSAIAAPAYAGIPVTHRGMTSHVTFFHRARRSRKTESSIDFAALAKLGGTQVMLMGVERIEAIARQMMEHGVRAGSAGRARPLGNDRPAGNHPGDVGEHRAARGGEEFCAPGGRGFWRSGRR